MSSQPEQIINAVFSEVPASVEKLVGRRSDGLHRDPPSIVAVPLGSSVAVVDLPGHVLIDGERTKRIAVREFQIFWSFFGASFAMCEELFLDTLRIIRKAAHNSVEFGQEEWLDQQEGQDGFVKFGNVITLTTTFKIPVFDARKPLTEVEAFTTEGKFNDEDCDC